MVSDSSRPSNPPFLRLRVRPTIVASLATTVAVIIGVFGLAALVTSGSPSVMELICKPETILLTFMVTLLMQFYLRGHYCRFAKSLGVSESLAFYFSVTLVVASFVGTLAFSADNYERTDANASNQR